MYTNYLTETGRFTGVFMNPTIIVLAVMSFILIMLINIKYSMILITFVSLMIPIDQRVQVFSFYFNFFRLLIFAGWIKVILNKNIKIGEFKKTDKLIIYWVIVSCITFIINQQYKIGTFKNQLGYAYNALGVYFLYRIFIKKNEDVKN